ncbi:MAG TPA: hypothetical protein VJI12_01985 [archaeon]|nr:hypothetical protein [archaeon]
MGRKKGFNEGKIRIIVATLAANPDGMWLRRISRETGYSPATVAHYLETVLAPLIEDVSLGSGGKPLLRVVRLKQAVLERLQSGQDIRQIMRLIKMFSRVE